MVSYTHYHVIVVIINGSITPDIMPSDRDDSDIGSELTDCTVSDEDLQEVDKTLQAMSTLEESDSLLHSQGYYSLIYSQV